MDWNRWNKLVLILAKKIRDDSNPDIIVPSMNGGLIPATIIAQKLKIKDIRPVSVGRKDKKRFFVYPKKGNIENISNKKILLIDDDIHSGESLFFIKKSLLKRGAKKIKIACVFKNKNIDGVDFFAKEVKKYPLYPWKKPYFGDR